MIIKNNDIIIGCLENFKKIIQPFYKYDSIMYGEKQLSNKITIRNINGQNLRKKLNF